MEFITAHMFESIIWREIILVCWYIGFLVCGTLLLIFMKKHKSDLVAIFKRAALATFILSIIFTGAVEASYYNARIYNSGIEYVNKGDYISAMKVFDNMSGFYDVEDVMEEIYQPYRYQLGIQYEQKKEWTSAMQCFIDSYYYSNAKDHLEYCTREFIKDIEESK